MSYLAKQNDSMICVSNLKDGKKTSISILIKKKELNNQAHEKTVFKYNNNCIIASLIETSLIYK